MELPRRVNVGCGTDIKPGWSNLDFQPGLGVDVVHDITGEAPLPYAPDSVDEILMSHVLEHLRDPLHVMEKLWDVAKEGCVLTIRCPHGASDDAWEDPTHVRAIYLQSFGYFSQPYHWRSQGYNYTADWQPKTVALLVDSQYAGQNKTALFERIKRERNIVREMAAQLVKISPARERRRELIRLPTYEIEACAK